MQALRVGKAHAVSKQSDLTWSGVFGHPGLYAGINHRRGKAEADPFLDIILRGSCMDKLLDAIQITYNTQYEDLPQWARDPILIGGPGFSVNCQEFRWYDYIVRTEYNGVKGMKREDVTTILHNASVLSKIKIHL